MKCFPNEVRKIYMRMNSCKIYGSVVNPDSPIKDDE